MKSYYNIFNTETFQMRGKSTTDDEISNPVAFYDEIKPFNAKNLFSMQNSKPVKVIDIPIKTLGLKIRHSNMKINSRMTSNKVDISQFMSDDELSNSNKNFSKSQIDVLRNVKFCKRSCESCKSVCRYRLSELNPNNDLLTAAQVKTELKIHKHPQSRKNKVTKAQRSLCDAKIELYNHYKEHHLNTN